MKFRILLVDIAFLVAPTLPFTLPTLPANFTLPPNLPPVDDVLPLVDLRVPGYGTIRGGTSYSWYTQRPYTFFRGVYYAKATTNETRFLPPEPIDPYPEDEVQDVWGINPKCAQREGIEDCLTVNIFTPKLPNNSTDPESRDSQLLPVMFWIHGGGFISGQTAMYTGFKYMEHDVVVVEVQYRLHALGWLCLDTDEVPGNAGIFDQIEALRWVQKYIKYFGGDPSRVTVFGESAGGSSGALLMLAPQARGLFHRVIGQSGAMLSDWALDRNASAHGYRIAELAGCPLTPYQDLLYCLRNAEPTTLSTAQKQFEKEDMKNAGNGFGGASPVIQRAGVQRVLTEEPSVLMESGNYTTDIDIMFGANQQEGIYVLGDILTRYLRPNNLEFDAEFLANDMIPAILKVVGIRDDTGALADAMLDKYMVGLQMGNFEAMIPGLVDICSVLFLKAGGWNTVIKHSKHSPGRAYWYSYEFRSRYSLLGSDPPIPEGINHADELQGLIVTPYLFNKTENTLSKRMLKVWTNFATYGNPTPDGWNEEEEGVPKFLPYSRAEQSYMRIDATWTLEHDYTNTYTVMGDWYRPAVNDSATTSSTDSTITAPTSTSAETTSGPGDTSTTTSAAITTVTDSKTSESTSSSTVTSPTDSTITTPTSTSAETTDGSTTLMPFDILILLFLSSVTFLF